MTRPFRRYFAGAALSGTGDWFCYVAITTYAAAAATSASGRALSVGAVALAHTLPRVVAAPLAGIVTDRFDRRVVLAAAEALRGVAALLMTFAAMRGELALLHAAHILRMALGAVSETAGRAGLPSWVDGERELERANASLGVLWAATMVVGIALGGAFTRTFGPAASFAVDAASFFLAVPVVLSLPSAPASARTKKSEGSLWKLFREDARILRACLVRAPLGFVHGAAFVVTALGFARGTGPAVIGVGVLHGGRAIGNAAGSVLARRPFWRWAATPIGIAGAALAVANSYGANGTLVTAASGFLWGLGMGATWTFATTWMQRVTPRAWLGRVVSFDAFAFVSAFAGGSACAVAVAALLLAGCARPTTQSAPTATQSPSAATQSPSAATQSAPAATQSAPAAPQSREPDAARYVADAATQSPATATHVADPPPSVEDRLSSLSITDANWAQRNLLSWTTKDQVDALRATRTLLVATARTNGPPSPFVFGIDTLQRRHSASGSLAKLLANDARFLKRRYAWTAAYATVLGLGTKRYGTELVAITLREDAWIVRFEPAHEPPMSARDLGQREIPTSEVLAHPERIGAVFHVRDGRDTPVPFREYVLVNEPQIERWAVGTPEVHDIIARETKLLTDLTPSPALQAAWRATLAFTNDRYGKLDQKHLDATLAGLATYDAQQPPLSFP